MKTRNTTKGKATHVHLAARDVPIPELWQLVVECRDERDQRALYERLTQAGYPCRVLTL